MLLAKKIRDYPLTRQTLRHNPFSSLIVVSLILTFIVLLGFIINDMQSVFFFDLSIITLIRTKMVFCINRLAKIIISSRGY
jgi:hypothetical protein